MVNDLTTNWWVDGDELRWKLQPLLFKVRHTGTSPLYDFDCGFLLKHLRICICNQNLPTVKFLINIAVEWHLIPVKNRLNSEFVISSFYRNKSSCKRNMRGYIYWCIHSTIAIYIGCFINMFRVRVVISLQRFFSRYFWKQFSGSLCSKIYPWFFRNLRSFLSIFSWLENKT